MHAFRSVWAPKWASALVLMWAALAAGQAMAQSTPPLPWAQGQDKGLTPAGTARMDAYFQDAIQSDRIPGAVVAIARDGKLVFYKAYGYQNKAIGQPMPLNAVFSLASMTKVMATVGALTYYEEGRLPLNAPISNWLPEFQQMTVGVIKDGALTRVPVKRQITVQDLMRHTSGLTYGSRGNTPVHKLTLGSSSTSAIQINGATFIQRLSQAPLLYEPGTVWDYGFGIDVLGLVEEKIAGAPLENILQNRLWSKLKMRDTTFRLAHLDVTRLAHPLPIDPLTGKTQSIPNLTQPLQFDCGGGCAFSTAGDYLRFGQMLLNLGQLEGERILSPATVEYMTSNHLTPDIQNNVAVTEPARQGYGFGLSVAVRTQRGMSAMNGHPGDFFWNGANGTMFWVDPQEKLVAVAMIAAPGEIRKVLREQVNALVYGALQP
jgi:CubicO group peptidase (beta-lactamase class C family)